MASAITIVIPTHNRHTYLQRSIAYYSTWKCSILIVDSSAVALSTGSIYPNIIYVHLPGMPLPQKLLHAFSLVSTEFVAMCADDDFLVADGIDHCLHFLQANRQYSVADGGVLFYKKQAISKGTLDYNLHYKTALDETFIIPDALDRLQIFFANYRSLFYSVHYTRNLLYIYKSCSQSFSNLYLNEYLTALYPVIKGYCRILPTLMLVRESTDTSDDKTTVNLDSMFDNKAYEAELENFIECVAQAVHNTCGAGLEKCRHTVTRILKNFADAITTGKQYEQQQYKSFTKKAGSLLLKVPLAGPALVHASRRRQSKDELAMLIKTSDDQNNLRYISQFIHQYGLL